MTHGKEALGSKLFASVGRPTKTYIQQFADDAGFERVDERQRERIRFFHRKRKNHCKMET